MTVLTCRRSQHTFDQPLDLPTPSTFSHLNYFDNAPKTLSTPSPSEISERFQRNYFNNLTTGVPSSSQSSSAAPSSLLSTAFNDSEFGSFSSGADQLMNGAFDFQQPDIRIQQATPVPSQQSTANSSAMLSTADYPGSRGWRMFDNGMTMGNTNLQAAAATGQQRMHQRASSSSSVGSNVSFNHPRRTNPNATRYQQIADSDKSPPAQPATTIDPSAFTDDSSRVFSSTTNHLPTPSHTPTQDSFLSYNYGAQMPNLENTMGAHYAMKQVLLDQQAVGGEEEAPGMSHSGRHSVSSFGRNSPATPMTVPSDDFEERMKMHNTNDFSRQANIPKLDRSLTEIYQDELYIPPAGASIATQPAAQLAKGKQSSLLSPYRGQLNERLQQAANARSQSPSSTASRGVSPFRQYSPHNSVQLNARLGTSGQFHEQQNGLHNQVTQSDDSQPKTISPKDALLEYHDTEDDSSKMSLYAEESSDYGSQFGDVVSHYRNSTPGQFDAAPDQSFGMGTPRSMPSTTFSPSQGPSPPQPNFNFAPPSIPGGFHGMPFATPQYQAPIRANMAPESTPDFPAHLTSMDSSASEKDIDGKDSLGFLKKPGSSLADTGTYSCTYNGCTQRFETPQKLQKHKREGHRQNVPPNVTPGIGSGMSSAALLARNSQTGPHKCERINPTTGKPCNTIFSRPYDLTRHEDTIHNIRKTKVRCALCVEEKTFSRNDALTRHMRVVHPEVNFPGKHRRRGGGHS